MSLQTFIEQYNSGTLPPPQNELEQALRASFVKKMETFRELEKDALEKELIETLDHLADLLKRYSQVLDAKNRHK